MTRPGEDERPSLTRPRGGFRPVHGRRVDVENCSLDEIRARTEYETSLVRNRIGLIVVLGSVAALVLAFVYGIWSGTMTYVGYVWGVAGPLAAGVIGFYFRREKRDG